jgi:membrane-associated phospholipid phosphatase
MTRRTSPELVAAGALLAVFVGLTVWARHTSLPLDVRVYEWGSAHRATGGWRQAVQETFGYLGNASLAAVTVAVALAVVLRNVGVAAAAEFLAATAGVALAAAIQHQSFTGRVVFAAPNFPSVHTVYAVASWGSLAVLAQRHGRPEVRTIFAVLIAGMLVTRVVSAAHLLSDVVAGACLGGAWLLAVLAVSSRLRPGRG